MSICRLSSLVLIFSFLLIALDACYGQAFSPGTPAGTGQGTTTQQGASGPASSQTTPEAGLSASPDSLSFEAVVGETSATQTVLITNKSAAPLSVTYTVSPAEFKADNNCQNLVVGASCTISLTFTPTQAGDPTNGSLIVNASPADSAKTPKVVLLKGTGRQHCKTVGFSFNSGVVLLFVVVGIYFVALVLVRWHMIAKPSRAQLVAEIKSVGSWAEAEGNQPQLSLPGREERVGQIRKLLDLAALPFNSRGITVTSDEKLGPLPLATRIFNAVFWTRGAELAGWSYAHQAEQQMIALLTQERVRAWMATAETDLRQLQKEEATAMADRIKAALQPDPNQTFADLQSLLLEAVGMIHTHRDTQFDILASWHNKMIWLVGCALLFIVAIALTFQNAVLMLVGAVGGLLSRLMQALKTPTVANDYGTTWGALFLSPLTGALAAWGGILLMILADRFQILGQALKLDWCNPYQPITLAAALLLGFTERLFDDLVTQIEPKVLPKGPSSPTTPAGTAPAGTAPAGTAPAGTTAAGAAPAETAPAGTTAAGAAPAETAPAGAAPAGTAPAGTAPAGAAPAETAPAGTTAAGAAPAETEPAGTTAAGAAPAETELAGTTAAGAAPAETELAGTELTVSPLSSKAIFGTHSEAEPEKM